MYRNKLCTYLLYVVIIVLFIGCSTTRVITDETVQTIKIETIKTEAPKVNETIVDIPLTKPDTVNIEPFGEYESKPIEIKKESNGVKLNMKVKPKVIIKRDAQGKPKADVNLEIQQDFEVQGKVTSEVKTTKSETTSFMYDFLWTLLKVLLPIIIIYIIWHLFKEKIKEIIKKVF